MSHQSIVILNLGASAPGTAVIASLGKAQKAGQDWQGRRGAKQAGSAQGLLSGALVFFLPLDVLTEGIAGNTPSQLWASSALGNTFTKHPSSTRQF